MEVILNAIAGLGLVGSAALVAWGTSLCLRHGFACGLDRASGHGALGSLAESSARPAAGL